MKKITFLFLFVPFYLFAQIKGDNVILIKTTADAKTNFTDFGRYLVGKGYAFENVNNDFYSIETVSQRCEKGSPYKLNITCADSLIMVRAVCRFFLRVVAVGILNALNG